MVSFSSLINYNASEYFAIQFQINKRVPLSQPVCDILQRIFLSCLIYSHLPHIFVSTSILICEPVQINRRNNKKQNYLMTYLSPTFTVPMWQSKLCDGRPPGPSSNSKTTWMICSCTGPPNHARMSSWGVSVSTSRFNQQALVIYNTGYLRELNKDLKPRYEQFSSHSLMKTWALIF